MHIFLIGMMGSGKSSVGKVLSDKLHRPFIDLDNEIELKSGKSIARIFSEDGEACFRKLETRVARGLNPDEPSVIASGGGFPLKKSNRAWMKKSGKVVWLKASPGIILERIRNEDRPLLPKPIDTVQIEKILNARIPVYKKADHMIETDNRSPEDISAEIMDIIK